MTVSGKTDVVRKLAALQQSFKKQLPAKIAEIVSLWELLQKNSATHQDLILLHRLTHTLAGSGGTFGATAVSSFSKELEQVLKSALANKNQILPLSNDRQKTINTLLECLVDVAESWQPVEPSYTSPVDDSVGKAEQGIVYLVEDDELFAKDLGAKLEFEDYRVKYFAEIDDFEAAFDIETPAIIIMDVVFKDGDIAGAEVISRLKKKHQTLPPVIFISVRNDINARLAAARAGARRYFCKPLDMNKLIPTLNGLTAKKVVNPFRILLIDDDETLLEFYATILRDAGTTVETLSDPMLALATLDEFNPDVILSDVYMPECTGPELAQVIRQDDAWAMTPIMFLSTETDINTQLEAMGLGGDDFLVKPIEPGHLISAVTARAKRARWTNRMNNELEAALRESKYQLTAMNQHDIVSMADVAGRITSVNDKFCEISGYSREELIGHNHRLVKSEYHPPSFYKELWETITSGKTWRGVICNRKKNGDIYWVESTIVPFLDKYGKPYKYVSARTDITTTRLMDERLSFAVEGAGDGVWDWNMVTNAMQFSRLYMEMLGYSEHELPHHANTWLESVHPDDLQRVQKTLQDYLKGIIENYSVELRLRCKDNHYKWILCRGTVVARDKKGQATRMIGIHSDITQQKEVQSNLTEAREEAEDANRAKSQFLSSMSHELRTPMNAIMGFGQLLTMDKNSGLTETQIDFANEIVKAGQHLLKLINEVLDLARIEAGRIDLSIESVGLGDVVAEALQLILPLAQKRGIEIHVKQNNIDVELEQLLSMVNTIRADRTRLKQVLLNILSNAVKYNRENGQIILSCQHTDDNQTRINITDTGMGIAREKQSQLFTAFSRLDADKTNIEGTGIGLVITKNIVELMGGRIGVQSEPGKGSTFWFELPADKSLHNADIADMDDDDAIVSLLDSDSECEHTLLYIEDNPANLRLVAQVMGRMSDIHMWSAHEPVLGLALAQEHKPDLILLDINLPGLSGYDVLKQLRQHESTRNIPVFAISANAMPKDIEKGLAAGFNDYITKPIDINALIKSVSNGLKNIEGKKRA